ncbi:unnamed protein product, partial [Larinioides sclopetarius]
MDSIEKLKCAYCERQFKHHQNLTRHLKNILKVFPMRNWNLKCPASGCEEMFQFRYQLRDHIQLKHEEKN